jgi:hypothetical protein
MHCQYFIFDSFSSIQCQLPFSEYAELSTSGTEQSCKKGCFVHGLCENAVSEFKVEKYSRFRLLQVNMWNDIVAIKAFFYVKCRPDQFDFY